MTDKMYLKKLCARSLYVCAQCVKLMAYALLVTNVQAYTFSTQRPVNSGGQGDAFTQVVKIGSCLEAFAISPPMNSSE